MRPGWPLRGRRSSLRSALRPGAHEDERLSTTRASEDDPAPPFPTHLFHVKPMSIVHSPARAPHRFCRLPA